MSSQSPKPELTELIVLRQRNHQLEHQVKELSKINATLEIELDTLKQKQINDQKTVGLLQKQIDELEHEHRPAEIKKIEATLEVIVAERTAKLQETVSRLQKEIDEREVVLREHQRLEAERQQAQIQLEQQEQFLRSVYNGAAHLIFVMDVLEQNEFRYVGWNAATEQVVGISNAQVVGKTPEEVFGNIEGAEIKQNYLNCCKLEAAVTYEECRTIQGQNSWWLTTLHPLKNPEGEIYRLVGTTVNISERKQAERALRDSQKRYRSLYTNTPVMMHSIDRQGRIDRVSNYWLSQLGYNLSQVIGQPWAAFLTEASRRYAQETVLPEFFKTGACKDVPYQFVKKNGETIDVLLSAISETDESGQIVRSLAVLVDVTEQKQIEEALRQEQEFTHVVIESVSDGVVACDAEGKLKLFNQAARSWHGCDPRKVPPEEWATLYDLYEADGVTPLKTERIPLLRAFQGESVRGAGMAIAASGQPTRYILSSGDPLFDSQGQKIGAVVAMHDITERKQAEEALQQSEAQLRQQARNLESALQELQHTQTQLIQSEKMSSLGQLVAGIAHEINNPVSFIYGNLSHAHVYTQDLLNLIRLYQTHYPNPVSEIQQESENTELDFLMEDLPKLLSSMRVGADRIQKIVTSLRNFSRMDEAEFKAVDIHDGIDSTLMILQNRLKAYNNRPEIQVIKTYSSLPLVKCYAGQLNQVFMNILSNAIDALEEKLGVENQKSKAFASDAAEALDFPPIIHIQTELTAQNQVTIRIADNGPGMPEQVRQRLFDPFFTTKAVGKGTGMGLSISYQIVTERHKGSLYCLSSPDQGAEFVMEIPVQE